MDFFRPNLSCPAPVTHGALDFAELERVGLNPDDVLDFSVNSNPFGPSPLVRAAIAKIPLDRYPDRECLALRHALAYKLGVSTEQIVVGNGTAELIWLAAFAFLKAGEDVLILGPTFGEYERSVRLMSANPVKWNALPMTGFTFDVAEITRMLDNADFRATFLCTRITPPGKSSHLKQFSPGPMLTRVRCLLWMKLTYLLSPVRDLWLQPCFQTCWCCAR